MQQPTNSISFDSKPPQATRDALKAYGFRWSRARQAWTAPQSVASAAVVDFIRSEKPGAPLDLAGLDCYVGERAMEAACGII